MAPDLCRAREKEPLLSRGELLWPNKGWRNAKHGRTEAAVVHQGDKVSRCPVLLSRDTRQAEGELHKRTHLRKMTKKTKLAGVIFRAVFFFSFTVVASAARRDAALQTMCRMFRCYVERRGCWTFFYSRCRRNVARRYQTEIWSQRSTHAQHNARCTRDYPQRISVFACCLRSRWNVARIFWIYLMYPFDKGAIESVLTEEGKTWVTHCHIEA